MGASLANGHDIGRMEPSIGAAKPEHASEAEILQPRVIVRPPAERPVILALALGDRPVVDAGDAPAHQAVLVELPVLVAVRAEPVAAVVAPLIGEAHGDAVAGKGPQPLD